MRASIESTEQIVEIGPPGEAQGVLPARVWIGKTESGIPIQLLVTRIAVESNADQTQFQMELKEQHAPPPPVQAFPLRMIL